MGDIYFVAETSSCCPEQYEGVGNNNKYIYIRYRHGVLSVYLYDKPDGMDDYTYLYEEHVGEGHIEDVLKHVEQRINAKVIEIPLGTLKDASKNKQSAKEVYDAVMAFAEALGFGLLGIGLILFGWGKP